MALRSRGIAPPEVELLDVAVDNVLWGGSVIGNADRGESTRAIKDFNDAIAKDDRVTTTMLSVGDGLTLACKRG